MTVPSTFSEKPKSFDEHFQQSLELLTGLYPESGKIDIDKVYKEELESKILYDFSNTNSNSNTIRKAIYYDERILRKCMFEEVDVSTKVMRIPLTLGIVKSYSHLKVLRYLPCIAQTIMSFATIAMSAYSMWLADANELLTIDNIFFGKLVNFFIPNITSEEKKRSKRDEKLCYFLNNFLFDQNKDSLITASKWNDSKIISEQSILQCHYDNLFSSQEKLLLDDVSFRYGLRDVLRSEFKYKFKINIQNLVGNNYSKSLKAVVYEFFDIQSLLKKCKDFKTIVYTMINSILYYFKSKEGGLDDKGDMIFLDLTLVRSHVFKIFEECVINDTSSNDDIHLVKEKILNQKMENSPKLLYRRVKFLILKLANIFDSFKGYNKDTKVAKITHLQNEYDSIMNHIFKKFDALWKKRDLFVYADLPPAVDVDNDNDNAMNSVPPPTTTPHSIDVDNVDNDADANKIKSVKKDSNFQVYISKSLFCLYHHAKFFQERKISKYMSPFAMKLDLIPGYYTVDTTSMLYFFFHEDFKKSKTKENKVPFNDMKIKWDDVLDLSKIRIPTGYCFDGNITTDGCTLNITIKKTELKGLSSIEQKKKKVKKIKGPTRQFLFVDEPQAKEALKKKFGELKMSNLFDKPPIDFNQFNGFDSNGFKKKKRKRKRKRKNVIEEGDKEEGKSEEDEEEEDNDDDDDDDPSLAVHSSVPSHSSSSSSSATTSFINVSSISPINVENNLLLPKNVDFPPPSADTCELSSSSNPSMVVLNSNVDACTSNNVDEPVSTLDISKIKIVGVDFGRSSNLATFMSSDSLLSLYASINDLGEKKDKTSKKLAWTRREFNHMAKKRKFDSIQNLNQKSVKKIESKLSSTSKRCLDVISMKNYFLNRLGMYQSLRNTYYKPVFSRLRYKRYRFKKIAEDTMLKKFKNMFGEPYEVCIVAGDWSSSKTPKNQLPSKHASILKLFKKSGYLTFYAHEAFTSCTCAGCKLRGNFCVQSPTYDRDKGNQDATKKIEAEVRRKENRYLKRISNNKDSYNIIQDILSNSDQAIDFIPCDENSLFGSFCNSLNKLRSQTYTVENVKVKVKEFMNDNLNLFQNSTFNLNPKSPDKWGGLEELLAACITFNVPIKVSSIVIDKDSPPKLVEVFNMSPTTAITSIATAILNDGYVAADAIKSFSSDDLSSNSKDGNIIEATSIIEATHKVISFGNAAVAVANVLNKIPGINTDDIFMKVTELLENISDYDCIPSSCSIADATLLIATAATTFAETVHKATEFISENVNGNASNIVSVSEASRRLYISNVYSMAQVTKSVGAIDIKNVNFTEINEASVNVITRANTLLQSVNEHSLYISTGNDVEGDTLSHADFLVADAARSFAKAICNVGQIASAAVLCYVEYNLSPNSINTFIEFVSAITQYVAVGIVPCANDIHNVDTTAVKRFSTAVIAAAKKLLKFVTGYIARVGDVVSTDVITAAKKLTNVVDVKSSLDRLAFTDSVRPAENVSTIGDAASSIADTISSVVKKVDNTIINDASFQGIHLLFHGKHYDSIVKKDPSIDVVKIGTQEARFEVLQDTLTLQNSKNGALKNHGLRLISKGKKYLLPDAFKELLKNHSNDEVTKAMAGIDPSNIIGQIEALGNCFDVGIRIYSYFKVQDNGVDKFGLKILHEYNPEFPYAHIKLLALEEVKGEPIQYNMLLCDYIKDHTQLKMKREFWKNMKTPELKIKRFRKKKNSFTKNKKKWGLKYCENCKKYYQRDENACINIIRIAVANLILNQRRPKYLLEFKY